MAATNGDVKGETAESFARDYLDDLFNNNKNLGAFEEETLDINIKSKYDDIDTEEEDEKKVEQETEHIQHSEPVEPVAEQAPIEPGVSEFTASSSTVVDEPLEPGQDTFQVNGHVDEVQVHQHNGVLESGSAHEELSQFSSVDETHESTTAQVIEPELHSQVIEPGQTEFSSQATESVSQFSTEPTIEPAVFSNGTSYQSIVEEEETQDTVAPIPTTRAKTPETEEELHFQKMGLSKNWWDSKRNESQNQKDNGTQPIDKFRTIKQNIKRGNTRSLLARFENLNKVTE